MAKIAAAIFIIGTSIAMLTYPNYDHSKLYFSDLGRKKESSGWFIITLSLTALLFIPVFIGLYQYLHDFLPATASRFLRLSIGTGMLSMVSLIFVGIFPANPSTKYLHNIFAGQFFIGLGVTMTSLTLVLLLYQRQMELSDRRPEDNLGFIFIPLIILFSNLSLWYSPWLQKLIVYVSLVYLLYMLERFYQIRVDKRVFYTKERFTREEAISFDQSLVLCRINF